MKKLLICLIILSILHACKHKEKIIVKTNDTYYTCSMHPQVHADGPGKCPICSMDLIPVTTGASGTDEIQLTDEQIKLANIHYDTLIMGTFYDQNIVTGTIAVDQKNNNSVSARVSGRVEKLYFQNVGDFIPKGAKLYELYSEELNTAKQEYLLLLRRRYNMANDLINFDQLLNAAKIKLQLWGLTTAQISALGKTNKVSDYTTFFSRASGYITNKSVTEGDYVTEGGTIYTLSNTSTVWVEAQIYSSQLSTLNGNTNVEVQIPDVNNKIYGGRIEFIDPIVNSASRIVSVRITLDNHTGELKPGMLVNIVIQHGYQKGITIPSEAVINSKGMQLVWLKTDNNKFKYQMVTTGTENSGNVEIKSGLHSGDVIVTSGAYLLNSEYKSRTGTNPMAGMKM